MMTIVAISTDIKVISEERDIPEKEPIGQLVEITIGLVIEVEAVEEPIIVVGRGGEISIIDLAVAEALGDDGRSARKYEFRNIKIFLPQHHRIPGMCHQYFQIKVTISKAFVSPRQKCNFCMETECWSNK